MKESHNYDYIVIGSGFGGSVSARLSEKGYQVAVLEMGKRWEPEDIPKSTGICNATSGPRSIAVLVFSV